MNPLTDLLAGRDTWASVPYDSSGRPVRTPKENDR